MVKWKDLWLTKRDSKDVIIGLWATKKDANYARCSLYSCDLKYFTQGFQLFTQHSVVKQYNDVSKIRFGENKTQKTLSSTSLSKALPRPSLTLDGSLQSKVSAAEAMSAFKVAEEDFTLQDCYHTLLLFKNMSRDSSTLHIL